MLNVSLNTSLLSSTKNVTYYIDGERIGTYDESPFKLGGNQLYDSHQLTNGTHTLRVVILGWDSMTTTTTITFTVAN